MSEYELEAPYKLFSDDADQQLVELYKARIKGFNEAQKEEYNRAKGTVASLIDSYNKADSQSLQESIINTMKSYETALPTHLRKAVEPYISHGPTSPMAEKRRQFTQQFKYPTKPTLNEAKGEVAEMENRWSVINYKFAEADYERRLAIHMTGVESAPEKLTFLPLPDGTAAIRGKDNRISLLSQQDLGLQELEKKTGISVKDMLLNPNGVPTGDKSFVNVNGRKMSFEKTFKPWESPENQYGQRMTGVEAMPASQWQVQHPPNLVKFLMDWKRTSPDDELTKDLKELANKKPKEVVEELTSLWPEYSFKIFKKNESLWKKALNLTPFWSSDEAMGIIPIPGVPRIFRDSSGKEHIYYYSTSKDLVFNNIGQPLGSLADVEAELNSRSIGGKP